MKIFVRLPIRKIVSASTWVTPVELKDTRFGTCGNAEKEAWDHLLRTLELNRNFFGRKLL